MKLLAISNKYYHLCDTKLDSPAFACQKLKENLNYSYHGKQKQKPNNILH